jgi:hypothetical protein
VLQATDERGHQGLNGAVHLAFIDSELARNVLYWDLCKEIVETSHAVSTFVAELLLPRLRP